MVCPNCKSADVSRDTSNVLDGPVGLPSMFVCNSCQHTGRFFPEISIDEVRSLPKNNKGTDKHKKDNTSLVNTDYGNFFVRVVWKITGPAFLLLGLIFLPQIKGIIYFVLGLFIVYVTYFKKRKLKD